MRSVELEVMSGPFKLAAQIDYPEKSTESLYPLVFIIPDRPRHTRDGYARGYPAFSDFYLQLAHIFVKQSYAVLRYDKGGAGKSEVGISDMDDMLAVYRKIRSLPQIDLRKIVIVAQGGGSGFIYRNHRELTAIAPFASIILLSTSINNNKIVLFTCPIYVLVASQKLGKTAIAIKHYRSLGHTAKYHLIDNVDDRFCLNNGNRSWFKEGGCEIHTDVFTTLNIWAEELLAYFENAFID